MKAQYKLGTMSFIFVDLSFLPKICFDVIHFQYLPNILLLDG